MKIVLAALAMSLLANGGSAFAADADCEEKFRQLLGGGGSDSGEYPFTARSITEMSGQTMTSTFVAQDDETFFTIDDNSKSWVVLRDGTGWVSTNEGKSWKKAYTIDPVQAAKQKVQTQQRAEEATNIACADGVEFEGDTYRQLSGDWKSVDGTGLTGHADYYLRADGRWHAQVQDMMSNGQRTKITQVRVPKGEELTVPEVE